MEKYCRKKGEILWQFKKDPQGEGDHTGTACGRGWRVGAGSIKMGTGEFPRRKSSPGSSGFSWGED